MDSEPLVLPQPAEQTRRPPVPLVAAVIPVASGVILWLVTGSMLSLCFAALGPLMLLGSLLDGARIRRRERRRAAAADAEAWQRVESELRTRHAAERRALRRRHPDVVGCLQEPPLPEQEGPDSGTLVVLGAGERPSGVRASGGGGDRAVEVRERARMLTDAPIPVPLGTGICVRAPRPIGAAVVRALLLQLCLRFSPRRLAIVGEALEELGLAELPHAARVRAGAWRIAVAYDDDPAPAAEAEIRMLGRDRPAPEGATTVIDAVDPGQARVRTREQGDAAVALEALSRDQAMMLAATLDRADDADAIPDAVALGALDDAARAAPGRLVAALGANAAGAVPVDLVEDGPHAIVTGMTGTGKSELLVSWVTAVAERYAPEQVAFVLADFKGGTAFDRLRVLPHVAAVMTDLDAAEARRGVQSLRAELRRREQVLAEAGARDISGAGEALGRLVIVVDEFAALLQEHPDLAAVFTDIAARGRALGMHLVLGTQRASGVVRDALAANCPLRLSLRVADAADSRLVIGSDEAAQLTGGPASRGLAFLRRPQDTEAVPLRIALTGDDDIDRIARRWAGHPRARGPWLPSLPARIPLEELCDDVVGTHEARADGAFVIGLLDEPESQRQSVVRLQPGRDRGLALLGGSGSGRTTLIRTLAAQHEATALVRPDDPEAAWDAIAALSNGDPATAAVDLVLCDDLDLLVGLLPAEHGQALLERLERLIRGAGERGRTVVVTAARATGGVARVMEALPERLLLRMGTKMEHLAAGGDPDAYDRDRAPGRASLAGRELQIAWTDHALSPPRPRRRRDRRKAWAPGLGATAVVVPPGSRAAEQLAAAIPDAVVGAPGAPLRNDVVQLIVGDAESWQRSWTQWQQLRAGGEVLVLAECSAELRGLAGVRELAPYARPGAGRAWSLRGGRPPRRVVLPGREGTPR